MQSLILIWQYFAWGELQIISAKTLLKLFKASGRCHGIGKEFFVQAQSRFRAQLCRGIIDYLP